MGQFVFLFANGAGVSMLWSLRQQMQQKRGAKDREESVKSTGSGVESGG